MATPTYTALATTTLGSSATSVTFSSIPATYRDLVLVWSGKTTVGSNATYYVNGETATANYYSVRMLGGDNLPTSRDYQSDQRIILTDNSRQNTAIIHFMDYSTTDKNKTILARSDSLNAQHLVTMWYSTSAITSITIDGATYETGSTFSLYGIEA